MMMPEVVQKLVQQFSTLWWESDTRTIPLEPSYTHREQSANEAHLGQFLDALAWEAKHPPRTRPERLASRDRLFSALKVLGRAALNLEDSHLGLIDSSGLVEAATEFAQQARRFDPTISGSDVYQASRNAWMMYSLQMLLGQPVQLTPAILAYSLLYPYSDNYLDDPQVPAQTKATFHERLARRLADRNVAPTNAQEQTIWALVSLIEGQFEPARHPQVFASLLAIHHAQNKGVGLLRRDASPYEVDVLGIGLEKGGASVLADGYLVAGSLTQAQGECLFGLGAFLQILDDLQDVEQNRKEGLLTVFSQTSGRWPLDGLTNRTFHFGDRVLQGLDCFDAPGLEPLKDLMRKSTALLLVEAAGRAERLYTRPYRRDLETCSPFRFSALNKHRKRLARQRGSLATLLEALALLGSVAPGPL